MAYVIALTYILFMNALAYKFLPMEYVSVFTCVVVFVAFTAHPVGDKLCRAIKFNFYDKV
jgi:hypothetical protein